MARHLRSHHYAPLLTLAGLVGCVHLALAQGTDNRGAARDDAARDAASPENLQQCWNGLSRRSAPPAEAKVLRWDAVRRSQIVIEPASQLPVPTSEPKVAPAALRTYLAHVEAGTGRQRRTRTFACFFEATDRGYRHIASCALERGEFERGCDLRFLLE